MHTNQTVQFGLDQRKKWMNFDHESLTIMEALDRLNDLIDESDPDCDVPNVYHAYQTAEGIRKSYPERDWMHLVGLIHDLGKIMCFYEQECEFETPLFPIIIIHKPNPIKFIISGGNNSS